MMRATMLRPGGVGLLCLLAACKAATTKADYPDDLRSPNYVLRSLAAREFAARRDGDQLPEAFDLLNDPESQIRALAWLTIRSLTPDERDFGYRPYLEEKVREGIVARWRAYWVESRDGAIAAGDAAARTPPAAPGQGG